MSSSKHAGGASANQTRKPLESAPSAIEAERAVLRSNDLHGLRNLFALTLARTGLVGRSANDSSELLESFLEDLESELAVLATVMNTNDLDNIPEPHQVARMLDGMQRRASAVLELRRRVQRAHQGP